MVIPSRDKAAHLRLTLRCLAAAPGADQHEVVVVDDGSRDDTVEVVRSAACDGLPVRRLAESGRGRAAARNAGADTCSGDLLVFLDDDIVVPPGFVAAHVAAHSPDGSLKALPMGRSVGDDPRVVHGPLLELPRAARVVAESPGDPYQAVAVERRYGRGVRNALERLVLASTSGAAPAVAPWLACVGGNVSMPVRLWRHAGGFDEGFGQAWGCEDLEFGYRLQSAGASFWLEPGASGFHLSHVRSGRWLEHEATFERFAARHPDPAVLALPLLLAGHGRTDAYSRALATATAPKEGKGS